jgi:hypothetical protein
MAVDLNNGGVDDEVHASFHSNCKIVGEKVLGEFVGVGAGDM